MSNATPEIVTDYFSIVSGEKGRKVTLQSSEHILIHDNIIDVTGTVRTIYKKIKQIPFQFGRVDGSFSCNNMDLTPLFGCPHTVLRGFYCFENKLTSLVGSPRTVGGDFNCHTNPFTTLAGMPDTVRGIFYLDLIPDLPMLSLLKYRTIFVYEHFDLTDIISKYAGKKPLRQAIIQCQKELIDNGFAGNASL